MLHPELSLTPQESGEGDRDTQWWLEKQKKGLSSRPRHVAGTVGGMPSLEEPLWMQPGGQLSPQA